MTISVVTTFHAKGLQQYGQRMIDSFIDNWPEEVKLHVYAEDCNPRIKDHNRIILYDLHSSVPNLVAFKNTWKDVPKANGDVSGDPIRSKRRDSGKGFKWDANYQLTRNKFKYARIYVVYDDPNDPTEYTWILRRMEIKNIP